MENSNPMFSAAAAASSSSSPPTEYYDVFLSFRGKDTRNNFTGHLRDAIRQKGFHTFFDDDKLERGKEINPELLKAIGDSHCSVVVLSENYADSSWCLTELAEIVERKGTSSGKILPIFYHVDPGDVRKQEGSYGEAFKKHEEDGKHSSEKVQRWRQALKSVGNLAGWHVDENTTESKLIREINEALSRKLEVPTLNIKALFGINSRLEKFESCMVSPSSDTVQFIGICGMGGIGKTTLAKAYYNNNCHKFDGGSFLANVREFCKKGNGLVDLQRKLLLNILKDRDIEIENVDRGIALMKRRLQGKKVLIVLDDVTRIDQLEALADYKDNWFGPGSLVIITTRDKSLLRSTGISKIYETEILNSTEALQLFSWKAFKSINPPENYKELCKQVMEYARDLPLALAVLGSFLGGKDTNDWISELNRLKNFQNKEIVEVLKLSFDDLHQIDQHIFLDIACFFNEYKEDNVVEVLNSCFPDLNPRYGINNLVEKSLLSIRCNELHMHDLLQDMGKKIVQNESPNEPGGQSRIWNVDDFCHILENGTGSDKIEAIVFSQEGSRKLSSFRAMSYMKNLRLLMILDPYNISRENDSLTPDLEYLSNHQLRLLHWDRFPYKGFPSSFRPYKLVQLKLVHSRIEKLWDNHTKPLENLKIIDLSNSKYLREFKDLMVVPNVEKLIFEGCIGLSEIHHSITSLEKLIVLNLASCKSLKKLPRRIEGMKSLEILNLNSCFALCELPDDCGHIKSLKEVDVRGSGISHLPSSIFVNENIQVFHNENSNQSSDDQEDMHYSSSMRFNVSNNKNCDDVSDVEINLDIGDDNNAVYRVQLDGEALREDLKVALLAKRTLEGDNSSQIIRQLKSLRTSTSTWSSVEICFDVLTENSYGLLHSSLFGQCIGMNGECEEFGRELFGALARRRNISGDSINKTQLRDFWEQISDKSFESGLQTFFDMMDKDADGRITENDVTEMISLSASVNRMSNIQKQAKEYAALIMEELDPENVGYVTIDNLESLLLRSPNKYVMYHWINLNPTEENNQLKKLYDKGKYFLMDNLPSSTVPFARLLRIAGIPIKILTVVVYPGNVLALYMSKPQGFKYKSGQYIFVNCEAVSWMKWRPYYITSSPADNYLSIHIQTTGNWSGQFKTVVTEAIHPPPAGKNRLPRAQRFPKISIDGPYAGSAQDYKEYEVVLLIGLGMGAAPMVSILKDIINNLKSKEDDETLLSESGLESSTRGNATKTSNIGFRTRKVYYYWVTREQCAFDWLKGIMNEVADMDELERSIEVHNYCTSLYEEGDARSALIAILQSLHYAKNGVDVVSGTRVKSHFGRPKWRRVYNSIAVEHPEARVGVFYRGPPMLLEWLRELASGFSHNTSTKFEFHNMTIRT